MIEIVAYDPSWPGQFERVAADLRAVLGNVGRIDHIGSTSVPGLAAKDRIDVQVGLPDLRMAADVAARLTAIGYCRPYAVADDHVPPGSQATDPREWADLKDPAVDLIMVAAEGWAERTGWRPDAGG